MSLASHAPFLVFLLSAVAAAAESEDGAFALVGATAGTAYDSNVTRSAAPEGDVAFDLGATGGAGWTSASGEWGVSGLAVYRGRAWLTALSLSTHVLGASGVVTWAPLPWLTAGLVPSGGYTLSVDGARNGPRFDARAFVKVHPTAWLSVRAGYGYLWRDAVDAVFSTRTHDVSALVRVTPLDWLGLSVSSSYSTGDDVVYRDVGGGTVSMGARRGGRGLSSTTTYAAVPVYAQTLAVSVGAEALLPSGFSVALDLAWVTSFNDVQPWSSWMPALLVAWDLP